MEKWLVQGKKADFDAIGRKFGISPIIARIIRNRDIIEEADYREYIECDLTSLNSPFMLKDMDKAVEIIINAINRNDKIRVIGDYDIDGICAGYILTTGLERLGGIVDFDVPERVMDGYGLNERLITKAHNDDVKLIVTCDNGIAASEQVKYAKNLGMKVIITDHHEVPYELKGNSRKYCLPEADAVIDQKQEGCGYPFKELCGAGIAYKLIEAIYTKAIEEKEYKIEKISETENVIENDKIVFMKELLVFTGIATIGDIVSLKGENRILVKNGLKYISEVNNLGLNALISANELDAKQIKSYHISFVIGPCINAGGRLETAKKAFELFRSKDETDAKNKAKSLKILNDQRKDMTVKYTEEAIKIIENSKDLGSSKVIVIYLKDCHESIAGIIAGRLKEIFYRPSFVLTDCEEGVKGSGRSIEGYSMYEEMVLADTVYLNKTGTHLFNKYGGHKMAAGLSIDFNKVDDLRKILNDSENIIDEMFVKKVWIDVPMPFEYITEQLIEQLDLIEPFGKDNEKPVFAEKCVKVNSIKIFGKNRNVISMNLENSAGKRMDATYFQEADKFLLDMAEKFGKKEIDNALNGKKNTISMNIIYYPEINEYRGFRNIRVVIRQYS